MSFTPEQIKARMRRLEVLPDLRLGGLLWNYGGPPQAEELLRELDSARSTLAIALSHPKIGNQIRALIIEALRTCP